MRWATSLLLVLASACLSPGGTICEGTGLICPPGTTCNSAGTRCLGTEGDCGNGIVDGEFGELCDDGEGNADEPDRCRLDCSLPSCGDGIVDALGADGVADTADDEVCDDGNNDNIDPVTSTADDCSADCRSNQSCGNGIVDFVAQEECDGGNNLGMGGCSVICEYLERVWREPAGNAGQVRHHAMAYDAARGRVVLFGGQPHRGHTYEWDGSVWLDVTPAGSFESPAPRASTAMAFDAARGRVVLFGGQSGSDETWEWDGRVWSKRAPATVPPPHSDHVMAYAAARQRVVMFGGATTNNQLVADTWEWDGNDWTEMTPSGESPAPRRAHAVAYDPARDRVVLFGGSDGANPLGDTWEWDGTVWTELTPQAPEDSPPASASHSMAWDAQRGHVVAFLDDSTTWEWNGTAWIDITPEAPEDSPPARGSAAMAYDLVRSRLVMFGGDDDPFSAPVAFDDTWEWDGSVWREVTPASATPDPRHFHGMAYDAGRDRLVVFGGASGAALDDTWEWDGSTWKDRTPGDPADSPDARAKHAMAYDARRGRVVLFGGCNNTDCNDVLFADTWEWDGSTWSEMTPAGPADSPSERGAHAMAYDVARGRVVLFGGRHPSTGEANDTWEWDGSAWSARTPADPASSPDARDAHAMAYDMARARVVLFGGGQTEQAKGEVWEWDGSAWAETTPPGTADVAIPRSAHAMTYDGSRRRVALYAGRAHLDFFLRDLLEWDGSAWTEDVPAAGIGPGQRRDHAIAYHSTRGELVLFGGLDGATYSETNETWILSPGLQSREACHSGLDGDGDGQVGCSDPDCWGYCTPACPPFSTAGWPDDCDATLPACGDGACNSDLESCRLCPADCGECDAVCGNYLCEADEDQSSCPGDCS